MEISFQLEARQAIFNQFIVPPALTHSVSTTFIEYRCQPHGTGGGGGGAATPTVQLNSIFSAKTDPGENPGKNPGRNSIRYNTLCYQNYYFSKYISYFLRMRVFFLKLRTLGVNLSYFFYLVKSI